MAATLSAILLSALKVSESGARLLRLNGNSAAGFGASKCAILHFVLRGSVEIDVERDQYRTSAQAGEYVLLFYGDAHVVGAGKANNKEQVKVDCGAPDEDRVECISIGQSADEKALVLTFAFKFNAVSPAAYTVRAGPTAWKMAVASGGGNDLGINPEKILQDCEGPGALGAVLTFGNLILVRAIRDCHRTLWNDRPMPVWAPEARHAAAAILAINAHPEENWTVAKLANLVGLSRSSFAKIFVTQFGVGPIEYLTKLRMERAAALLKAERFSISEIGARVGYAVPSSFARAFETYHGATPTKYINRLRAESLEAPSC